ncbi:MAG: dephospho-CoA kinase [Thermoanaerobaculia bacterium]
MPALRVGLTGGLASGKSTVAKLLADAGFQVVDADQVVAELYAPGQPGARAVSELFGANYLGKGGGVDKPRLARLAFSDDVARARLEAAIHPLVRAFFSRLASASAPGTPIVLEATRLVEAGYAPDFDLIVTVEGTPEVRLERAVARGLSRAEALERLAAQGDGAVRRKAAHKVIVNDGTPEELAVQVEALVNEIRDRAR